MISLFQKNHFGKKKATFKAINIILLMVTLIISGLSNENKVDKLIALINELKLTKLHLIFIMFLTFFLRYK